MKGPVQWFRRRLSTFVELRVRNFIEAEKLSVLRDDLSVLRDDLSVLRDDSRMSRNAQSEIRSEFQSFRKEVSEDQRVQALEGIVPPIIDRINKTDHNVQALEAKTKDIGDRHDALSAGFEILASRIRANPFWNSSFEVTSTRDGSFTIGYEGEAVLAMLTLLMLFARHLMNWQMNCPTSLVGYRLLVMRWTWGQAGERCYR